MANEETTYKNPELFESIILIDSPLLGSLTSIGIKFAKFERKY